MIAYQTQRKKEKKKKENRSVNSADKERQIAFIPTPPVCVFFSFYEILYSESIQTPRN